MARRTRHIRTATAVRFAEDIEAAKDAVWTVLSRYHDAGQTRWLGGSRDADAYEAPAPAIERTFKKLRAAADALADASHEMIMYSVQEAEGPLENPRRKGGAKRRPSPRKGR